MQLLHMAALFGSYYYYPHFIKGRIEAHDNDLAKNRTSKCLNLDLGAGRLAFNHVPLDSHGITGGPVNDSV